jgi:hypothetical protein
MSHVPGAPCLTSFVAALHLIKFRYVRRSSDSHTWLFLILSLLGIVASSCAMLPTDPFFPRWLSLVICGLLLTVVVWCVRAVIHPFEWEVAVDDGQICWGRADRPDRQQRVVVSQLVRLIHDKTEGRILANNGAWQNVQIGAGILMYSDEQNALVDYLRQKFPQLKIETT